MKYFRIDLEKLTYACLIALYALGSLHEALAVVASGCSSCAHSNTMQSGDTETKSETLSCQMTYSHVYKNFQPHFSVKTARNGVEQVCVFCSHVCRPLDALACSSEHTSSDS